MEVRAPFGREHDHVKDLHVTACASATLHRREKGGTYTEDGTDSSCFDGSPDQPFDYRVRLWKTGDHRVSTTISAGHDTNEKHTHY